MEHVALVLGGFDATKATKRNVRVGYFWGLPFRLRLGTLHHQALDVDGGEAHIWVRNRIDIPTDPLKEEPPNLNVMRGNLDTDVLVATPQPQADEEIQAVRAWAEDQSAPFPKIKAKMQRAIDALNRFLVAYASASGELASGGTLALFRPTDAMTRMRCRLVLICEADHHLSDDQALQWMTKTADWPMVHQISQLGWYHDLEPEVIASIPSYIQRDAKQIHYELAFEAKSKMVAFDHRGALLLAVAALEGAHAAFVQQSFAARGMDQSLADDYMKELGITLCMGTTPGLFMEPADRLADDLVSGCKTGIRYRNEIMHARRNKQGTPLTRVRTRHEINNGYSMVLKVYAHYRKLVEREEGA